MENKQLIPVEIQEKIKGEVRELLGGARIEKIDNQSQMENTLELTKKIKVFFKDNEAQRKTLVSPLNNDVKSINSFFKAASDPINALESNLKSVMVTYQEEQELIRIEAQRKADEEARRERERMENEARKKRETEEKARAEAEEKRRQAAETENAEERASLEKEARKEEAKAERAAETAEIKESLSSSVVAPTMEGAAKAAGFSSRKKYSARVTDKKAFILWAMETGRDHLILIDEKTLNKMVAAEKENFKAPGISVEAETIAAVRTK